jgi:hypothetical protein
MDAGGRRHGAGAACRFRSGTSGSNPLSSSGESCANPTLSIRARRQLFYVEDDRPWIGPDCGYARVSTEAQNLTGATAQPKAAGCQKIFREKITGTTANRPQLKKLMAVLAQGDVVIIPVDRLSRDTTDLLVIAREMQRAGAGIRSLAEPFLDTTSDFAEIVFAILGVAAKLEHRRIKERTARGRAEGCGIA